VLFLSLLLSGNASSGSHPNTGELEQQLLLLDRISYHPSLLPLILQNIDYLELTPAQQQRLQEWRKINAPLMLDKMKEVAQGRIEFIELSLRPGVSGEALIRKQHQLFKLQEEVLSYKLACRQNILETFTESQWDALQFLMAERQTDTNE
jgi:hypothetical protein